MRFFEAVVMKDIFWHDKSYRQGDTIKISYDDMRSLSDAGVIGNIRPIRLMVDREFAIVEPEEKAVHTHKRKPRGKK